jgi:hypothetical protein
MARNAPLLPRPRRGRRAVAAASTPGGGTAPTIPAAASVPDDLRTVYGWLSRLTTDSAEVERLLVEILRRSRTTGPACLRAAPETTRLQHLTVSSVLRLRGVL